MTKIEQQIVEAIQTKQSKSFSNTVVSYDADTDTTEVRLHGNLIARIKKDLVKLSDCGWSTRTTVGRLNTILTAIDLPIKVNVVNGITNYNLNNQCIGLNNLDIMVLGE